MGDNKKENNSETTRDFRSLEIINNDTVNRIDVNGLKQGKWYERDLGNAYKNKIDTVIYKDGVKL